MTLFELFLTAVGLSMDAFAVAICKGLSTPKIRLRYALVVGLWFGIFQGAMPLIGYFLGTAFADIITAYDHWVGFGLLALIGGNMIRESLSSQEEELDASLSLGKMLPLAVATSIDALAVGVGFACLEVQIVPAVSFIAVITLALSMVGVKIGNVFGQKFKKTAEIAGGVILILLGFKILLEHLGILVR